jgi:predicted transposase YdaD
MGFSPRVDIKKSKAEGFAKGLAEGENKKAREIARRLISKGMSIEEIELMTDLNKEVIQELTLEISN